MSSTADAGDPAATTALATLVGVALGMLREKGLLEREELAAIFSLTEEALPDGAYPSAVLDTARAAAETVQAR